MARAGDMADSYRDAFTAAVRAIRDVEIGHEAWDGLEERLPDHLRVNFRVEDERGRLLDESTDLIYLQRSLAPAAQRAVTSAVGRVAKAADARVTSPANAAPKPGVREQARPASALVPEQTKLTTWPNMPHGALPDEVAGEIGGASVRGYPALVDEKGIVALRVLADAHGREQVHAGGVGRLL